MREEIAREVQTCASSIEFVNSRADVVGDNNNARKLACPKTSSATAPDTNLVESRCTSITCERSISDA